MTEKRNVAIPFWLILIAIVALFAGGVGIFVMGKQHAHANVSAKAVVAREALTVRIPVQGMICVVCAGNVKKTLASIDGVQEADIDLERREARVRYDAGRVSPARFVAAINQLGYKAGTPVPEAPR